MLSFEGGATVEINALAKEILAVPNIDGLTLSGGEPMSQAAELARLIDRLRETRDLSVLSYTGYTLEELRMSGTSAQKALLDRLDIVIDGLYVRERHTDLRWRGSDNQRVHLLTPRHRNLAGELAQRGTWIEFELGADGSVRWMGIPPVGFRAAVPRALEQLGIEIQIERGLSHEWFT
jgi:anaerobic ribonucleoside-triphosphate reductase activating protein